MERIVEWLQIPWVKELAERIQPHLPQLAIALGVLIGGWLVAWIVRLMTFGVLKRTTVDDKIAELLGFETEDHAFERVVAKSVYYVVLAFVFVAFFDRLQISAVTEPVLTALSGLTSAIPSILKAIAIALVGLLAASALRRLTIFVLEKSQIATHVENILGDGGQSPKKMRKKKDTEDEEETPAIVQTLGEVVYWFVLVVASVPVFEALRIGALAAPLTNAINTVTVYLPRIVAALVLLVVGYVAGRLARGVITRVSERVGVDQLAERFGFSKILKEQTIGSLAGTFVMAVIVLHFAISAVGRLDIEEVSRPLGLMLEQVYAWLPKMLAGSALLALGAVLAKLTANFISRLLAGLGFNTLLSHTGIYQPTEEEKSQEQASRALLERSRKGETSGATTELFSERQEKEIGSPADVAGVVAGAVVVLLFLRQALETMSLSGLAAMLDTFLAYLPHAGVAAVLLGSGLWAGRWARARVDELTKSSNDRLVRYLGPAAHVLIVSFSIMLALEQLGIGEKMIALSFGLILGAACLALALAFGLGGRDVASKILEKEYRERGGS